MMRHHADGHGASRAGANEQSPAEKPTDLAKKS
jgi:hypothetical protein